ncbi:MAG: hypothetical protein HGA20_14995 [Geobacteraceae bacterium]|nr:hypothetical protein [Geobacteraceae bacterium]
MGFSFSLDFFIDPIGTTIANAAGVNSPLDYATTSPANYGEMMEADWVAFKHLLVPDMRRDREVQVQSSTNARTIVYGRSRVGNQIAYAETTGTESQTLHLICIHAGHEIDGYEELYFDDKLVATAAGGWAIQAPFTGKATVEFYDGTQTAACASMVAASAGGWTLDHKLLGVAYTHITLEYDEAVYPAGVPGVKVVLRGKKVYDPATGKTGWNSNPILCIRDYMLTDKRTGGMGCDLDEVNATVAAASRSICDQTVWSLIPPNQAPGVKTLIKPIPGVSPSYPETRYTLNGVIKLDGVPTQFIKDMLTSCAGDAVYSAGEWKIYAGAPAASVATIDESWLNGGLSFKLGSGQNEKNNSAKGTFTNSNDYWADTEFPPVPVGISTPPSAHWSIIATPVRYDAAQTYTIGQYVTWDGKAYIAYNSVPINTQPPSTGYWSLIEAHDNSLTYPSGHTVQRGGVVYISTTTVPISNPYLAEDGGELLEANLALPFTITSSEAQRLAKIAMEKSRRGFTLAYPCNHKAFKLDIMDVVTVNNDRLGIAADFRVIGWEFSFLGGTSLALSQYDAAIYDWTAGDSTPLVPPVLTNLPDPWTVAEPTSFDAIEVLYAGVAVANTKSRLDLTWVSAQASGTLYEVAFDGKILPQTTDTSYSIYDLAPGTYDVSVRAKSSLGTVSPWVTRVELIRGKYTAPANVTGFTATFTGNLVNLKWNASTETDTALYEIRTGASWAAGTVLQQISANAFSYRPTGSSAIAYWIAVLDTSGNYSAAPATASVTIPAAVAPTAISCTGQFLEIDVAVTYDHTRSDTDYIEILANTTNVFAENIVGITRDGRFKHQGLSNGAVRYYWARVVNVFGQTGARYPSGITGISGMALNSPTAMMGLLNASLTTAELTATLQALFRTGLINGVSTLGLAGDMVIDGTMHARSLVTSELVVGDNIAMGANATLSWAQVSGKPTVYTEAQIQAYATSITNNTVTTAFVNALNVTAADISATTLTGKTIQTAASGERFVVDVANKSARFYDSSSLLKVYLGTATAPNGSNGYAYFGDSTDTTSGSRNGVTGLAYDGYAVYGYSSRFGHGVHGASANSTGVYGQSGAQYGVYGSGLICGVYGAAAQNTGTPGYGAVFQGGNYQYATVEYKDKAPIRLIPSTSNLAPTHQAEIGALWVTSTGVLYINTSNSTTWTKVGAQ